MLPDTVDGVEDKPRRHFGDKIGGSIGTGIICFHGALTL